jgi:hypothetical protein
MKYKATLALLLVSCAGTSTKPADEPLGTVKANIQLPSGTSITQVAYTLACTPTPVPTQEATGTWTVITDSTGLAKADGSLGGLDPNDTCTLVLSAQDSWGLDNSIQNCSGEADGVQVGSALQMNLVCVDSNAIGPDSGGITADVTVTTTQGTPYQCSGIGWYTSAESDTSSGYLFSLNMGVTVPTSPQTVTWSSSDANATWYETPPINEWTNTFTLTGNPTTDPATSANPSALNMPCNAQGNFTVTLTVQDTTTGLLFNGQPGTCPADTNTFPITCY